MQPTYYKNDYDDKQLPRPQKKERNRGRVAFILIVALLFLAGAGVLAVRVVLPAVHYNEAAELLESGEYLAAHERFAALGNFSDAPVRAADCLSELAEAALAGGDLDVALEYLGRIEAAGFAAGESLQDAFYDYAFARRDTEAVSLALRVFEEVIPDYRGSAYWSSAIRYDLGITELELLQYESAFAYFSKVDAAEIPEVADAIARAQTAFYLDAVAEFAKTGAVPERFFADILDGFEDSEKYRIYSELQQSDWAPEVHAQNLEKIYELGDFLDTAETGFAFYRLYERRYSNELGSYLEMGEDGSIDSNLPQYFLSGYYGLYSKVEDGVYFIGSDQARWTKQFGFVFENFDETLWVYCYSTGYRYQLTLEY